ncbi:MAG: hypothetical protein AAF543_16780 [Pseudomonadota bacterium]
MNPGASLRRLLFLSADLSVAAVAISHPSEKRSLTEVGITILSGVKPFTAVDLAMVQNQDPELYSIINK